VVSNDGCANNCDINREHIGTAEFEVAEVVDTLVVLLERAKDDEVVLTAVVGGVVAVVNADTDVGVLIIVAGEIGVVGMDKIELNFDTSMMTT
jgi:hypothetical protein